MEVDFDKEIDALLRNARRDGGGPVYVGDAVSSPHLDADELAAFAENAVPAKTRGAYTLHLADCDRCRKMLSNLAVMNSEAVAAPAPASAITIAERSLPWYRKLFLFPNLAYVMGGLVLIFGGFLAFTVVQRSGFSDGAIVTQVSDNETRGGPRFDSEPSFALAANSNSNGASNSSVSPSAANALPQPKGDAGVSGPNTGGMTANEFAQPADDQPVMASPPAPPPAVSAESEMPQRGRDVAEVAKNKAEDKVSLGAAANSGPMKDDAKQRADLNIQSGPMNQNDRRYQSQLENADRRSQALAKKSAPREEADSDQRVISGRRFERKDGVWYDQSYQGRPTINVRRGTEEFNRLDAGLKNIANSLPGTVVIVWGAKAYRIN